MHLAIESLIPVPRRLVCSGKQVESLQRQLESASLSSQALQTGIEAADAARLLQARSCCLIYR